MRLRWAVAAAVACTALLAGCVSSGTSNAGGSGGGGNKTVTVWSWFVESTMQKAIKAYEKAHPGVTVNYTYYNYDPQFITALKAAAKSGTLPDIIGLQPGSLTQQYRPYLESLNSLAAKTWGSNWEQKIYPVDLEQMRMGNPAGNDNFYMIPHESQVLAIWYNKDIFAKLHITVPTTLAELISDSKKLKSAGYLPMYQGAAGAWQNENVFLMLANQVSKGITDQAQAGKVPWTAPAFVTAMNTWHTLFTSGVFQSGALGAEAYPTGAQLFAAGKVGMMALGSWWLQESELTPRPPLVDDLKAFGFFQFPAIKAGGQPGAVVGGVDVGYGLTKNGAKNPQAWKFLSSLVDGPAGQAALTDINDLPAFKGISLPSNIGPNVKSLYSQFNTLLPTAVNQRFSSPVVENALDNALAGVAAGKQSTAQALASIEKAQQGSGG
jgi:raffinose/stachyose/melibiose transport system substrate-binding protein